MGREGNAVLDIKTADDQQIRSHSNHKTPCSATTPGVKEAAVSSEAELTADISADDTNISGASRHNLRCRK